MPGENIPAGMELIISLVRISVTKLVCHHLHKTVKITTEFIPSAL